VSFHDFEQPADPDLVLERVQRFTPDFVKIVTTAQKLTDSVTLLEWLNQHGDDAQLVAIAMGEAGILTRILSLRAGSAFTFAAAPDGAMTAPGQITARTLKELYQIGELDQATRIYGVAGNPVAHSLSPLMQNTAFRRERMNAVYLPLKTESLGDLLTVVRRLPLSGLSVTMPLKQQILPYLSNVDPLTARIGACNTVRMGSDGNLVGFNTDVAGIVRPLEKRLPLKGARVLVLGAGGASRAAVFGLADKGAEVFVWSRGNTRATELAAEANVTALERGEIAKTRFDVLVNGTPCGMHGQEHPLPLEADEWDAGVVFDLVYNPLETPLLAEARHRGATVIQGVEMFVQQGVRQFELWTGKPAPEAEMQRVVLYALQQAQAPRTIS
jgi:3-dehydroquinate dehydratase/shikimate dehydrogenase